MKWLIRQGLLSCLIILTLAAVSTNCMLPCLTWKVYNRELSLICQLKDFSSEVYFKDGKGKTRGYCDFKAKCNSVDLDKKKQIVTLKLHFNEFAMIEGKWSCIQGKETYSSSVTENTDTAKLSYLKIDGQIIPKNTTKQFISITCSSCHRPYNNGIEYLINGKTVDSIFYNPISSTCRNGVGTCMKNTCSCSLGGHRFIRSFEIDLPDSTLLISCLVAIKDNRGSLHRISTLRFDGKRFIPLDSNDTLWRTKPNYGKSTTIVEPNMIDKLPFFMYLTVIWIVCLYKLLRRQRRSYSHIRCFAVMVPCLIVEMVMLIIANSFLQLNTIAKIIAMNGLIVAPTVGICAVIKLDKTEIITELILTTTCIIYAFVFFYVKFQYKGYIFCGLIILTVVIMIVKKILTTKCATNSKDACGRRRTPQTINWQNIVLLDPNIEDPRQPRTDTTTRNEWKKEDKTFTVTRATRYVQNLIKKEDIVTVIGSSGTGKSSLIHHVALHIRGNYNIVPNVTCPEDIIQNRTTHQNQIFVIEDMCGKNSINKQSLQDWVNFQTGLYTMIRSVKRGNSASRNIQDKSATRNTTKMKILVSCHLQIFDDPRFQALKMFTDQPCNLQCDDHRLLPIERRNITECHLPGSTMEGLKQYLSKKSENGRSETLDDLLGNSDCEFFPLLCKLSLGKTSEQLITHFKGPDETIENDIKLSINYWSFNYHALVFCCMFHTGFDEGYLNFPITVLQAEKEKIDDILSSLEISLEEDKTRKMLRKAFDILDGKFLQKKGSKYFIIHDKVYDIIANLYGKILPKLFDRYIPSYLITEKLRKKCSSQAY